MFTNLHKLKNVWLPVFLYLHPIYLGLEGSERLPTVPWETGVLFHAGG